MLDLILFVLAALIGGGEDPNVMPTSQASAVISSEINEEGSASALQDDMIKPGASDPGAEEGFVAEPQTATGKFTTATEVKPILAATKGNWVAVREYNGQDLLYVTHVWSWRCGLHQMRYAINGGGMQIWPLPPCHDKTNAPNAIIDSDGLPFATFKLGSIKSIDVELLFDDLSTDSSAYARTDVLMP